MKNSITPKIFFQLLQKFQFLQIIFGTFFKFLPCSMASTEQKLNIQLLQCYSSQFRQNAELISWISIKMIISMQSILNAKSNETLIYALLAFEKQRKYVNQLQNCKRTGTAGMVSPQMCYDQASALIRRTAINVSKIDPLCMMIFNDCRECLFQGDSHLFNCKEELNQLVQCQTNPANYVKMLQFSTYHQKIPKKYNFVLNFAPGDGNQ